MERGRLEQAWNIAAQILALMHNAWKASDEEPAKMADYHPFMRQEAEEAEPNPAAFDAVLTSVFGKEKGAK